MGACAILRPRKRNRERMLADDASVDAEVAQLVEHHLAKVRVAGSSPVFRSISLPGGFGAPSSSGRTADFGSVNRGSNPRGAASAATCPSGQGAVCKTAYTGSIP